MAHGTTSKTLTFIMVLLIATIVILGAGLQPAPTFFYQKGTSMSSDNTIPGGFYIGSDGIPHDAHGNVLNAMNTPKATPTQRVQPGVPPKHIVETPVISPVLEEAEPVIEVEAAPVEIAPEVQPEPVIEPKPAKTKKGK